MSKEGAGDHRRRRRSRCKLEMRGGESGREGGGKGRRGEEQRGAEHMDTRKLLIFSSLHRLLLTSRANPNAKTDDGKTALALAAMMVEEGKQARAGWARRTNAEVGEEVGRGGREGRGGGVS
eukprot:756695-Hanusia_phi.AAC.3